MSERGQTRGGSDGARDRARRRESGRSLRASHHRTRSYTAPQVMSRLRDAVGQLQTEGRGFDKEEELRWKINQMEQDKLALSSKYNQELSSYEVQLTRCRALLEKSEAQRQTLEYELSVVKRDTAAHIRRDEDKTSDLIAHNQQLDGLTAELRQRAADLQKALEVIQQSRFDNDQIVQSELRDRDHLIHSISTEKELLQQENTHLDTQLQEHKDTLQEMKSRMDRVQRDGERNAEELRLRRAELRNSLQSEEKIKKELEAAVQRVKALEECVDSERASHQELKLRLRDVQAALNMEKSNHSHAVSSLELIKHRYRELDRAHTQERERADHTQHTLTLVEQEFQNTKTHRIGQLEREKAESDKLIGQLEREKAESDKLIGQLEREKAESGKLIGQLEREKAESDKLIGQLEREKAESDKLIGQLEREKAESDKMIGQLEREKAESDKLIGQLEREKAESDKMIGQLEREKAESDKLIGQLETEKAESYKLIGQLEREKAESDKLIGQLEREKAESDKMIGQLEREKAESDKLIGQLETEKAESYKLIGQLEREKAEELNLVQKRLSLVEESYDGLLKEITQLLHHHQGAPPINTSGNKQSSSALMDVLRRVLQHYHTELKDLVKAVDILNKENKGKDEIIAEQRRHIQECEAQCVCVSDEAECLRVCLKDAAATAERAQTELQSITHHWEEEREQHSHTKTHIHTLAQEHEREQQERLAFLHSLYQRLLTGCVLVAPPQSMMGIYSWTELSLMIQEQADSLTSDLKLANQRIACLDSVCEGKEAALKSVCEQLKKREKSWIKQREELNTHHTHLINQLHKSAQDLRSRLGDTEERLRVCERARAALQQEVGGVEELLCVCRHDEASFLAACALLAGCVCALHGRVCALVHQKALLQRKVCDAESLQQEVRALLCALSDPGVKGQSEVRGCVWKFRACVIAVMAALRLRTLGANTHTLFRVREGVCVSMLRLSDTHTEEEQTDRVVKMLTSSQLCVILHTCMQDLQTQLQRNERSVCVLAAACSSFTKLMDRLLCESEAGCYGDVGSLTQRLGHGLNNLQKTHHLPLTHHSNRVMFATLQQHFLVFTQRLHATEVERRELRMELSRLKRRNTQTRNDTHTRTDHRNDTHTRTDHRNDTHTQFRSVCEELRSALHREQQAQTLLHEQAAQLQEFSVTMETHTSQQLEKDHTLAQAVQSLSAAKAELKKREQSLRLLRKQLGQSQQEKQELQQNINRAEHTLNMAARSKECLMRYMVSVECSVRELKDRLLSHSTSSRGDITLHLPMMQRDPQGGAEVTACQALVKSFTEVCELACNKTVCVERVRHVPTQ